MSQKRSIQNLSIDGNCLCFNFINTVSARKGTDKPYEYLSSYARLLMWCERLGVMAPDQITGLAAYAEEHSNESNQALEEMIAAREMLYQFFSAIAAEKTVNGEILKTFNRQLSESLSRVRFNYEQQALQLGWPRAEPDLKEPLWRVMKSAYDILTEEPHKRIKECEACGWIFLDQSKNRSRRWCNMQTCGSAHKAKKYYHKKKKKG